MQHESDVAGPGESVRLGWSDRSPTTEKIPAGSSLPNANSRTGIRSAFATAIAGDLLLRSTTRALGAEVGQIKVEVEFPVSGIQRRHGRSSRDSDES